MDPAPRLSRLVAWSAAGHLAGVAVLVAVEYFERHEPPPVPVYEVIEARAVDGAVLDAALEAKRAREAAAQRAERERQRAAREAERLRIAAEREAEAKAQREAEAKARREAALQAELEAEEAARRAAAQRAEDDSEIGRYVAAIVSKVQQNFVYPSFSEGLKCILYVEMRAGGQVIDARVAESSGDAAFDRQAVLAVRRASPLPVPDEPRLFDRMREMRLVFDPS